MGRSDGRIELDRSIDSIQVGYRFRQDMGDIDQLAASIRKLGLLQPPTITPDGTLICGARRLEAVKALGLKQVNVWVRSGISSRLQLLLAEQHENLFRKPFTPTEAAALYRELKILLAEDAAHRQNATQFGSHSQTPAISGGANLAPPSDRKTRAQAAQLVTGNKSYTTLERVGEVERIAADPETPPDLRAVAVAELASMDADGKVYGHYQKVKAAQYPGHDSELVALAQDALSRVQANGHVGRASQKLAAPVATGQAKRYSVRAFLLTWTELRDWAEHYDPAEIGQALTDEQWADFQTTVAATVAFTDAAQAARTL
jgi:ParB family transcriptional regulator, chromosome partitioning protein